MAYRMTLEDLSWLRSAEGQRLLDTLALDDIREETLLVHLTRLRREYSREHAAAGLETAILRHRAALKFERAGQMYFTRDALEQASGETVSRYRGTRFGDCATVLDLGCGIGGDSIALNQNADVVGIERDELRLQMARSNVAAYGHGQRFEAICGDWTQLALPRADAIFLDPSRRMGDKRIFSIFRYEPSLAILPDLVAQNANVAAKIAPGVDYGELETLGIDAEVEFISEGGTCKEAVLWSSGFRTCARRATLLPEGATLTDDLPSAPAPITPLGRYLYEPDNAVIRAQLVEHLAVALGATKIHDRIAYLTGDRVIQTPFARAYEIQRICSLNVRALHRCLREMNVGNVIVKKRGVPIDPDAFRKQLHLAGENSCILILTRTQDAHCALICQQVVQDAIPG